MSYSLLTIGIVGLVISVIVLIVLFMFLKIAFWIGLVITIILTGVWMYFLFKNKSSITNENKEEFANSLNKEAEVVLHTATDADLAGLKVIGDLKQGKLNVNDANINGKLFFKDPSMSPQPNGVNNSDPYFLERINTGGDQSVLRLTMNDNAHEALEIFGNSCELGNCNGAGGLQHKFYANGDAWHNGHMRTKGDIIFTGDNGWIVHTPDDGRKTMYIAPGPEGAWDWGKTVTLENNGYLSAWGGGLQARGGASEHNRQGWGTHFPWAGDNKNYIRGDTEIRGNTNNIGDLSVGGKLQSTQGLNVLNADPGPLVEKKYGNNIGDRYGVGQFPNGSARFYTASAYGPATLNLSLAKSDGSFDDIIKIGNNRVTNVSGDIAADKNIIMKNGSTLYNTGRQHIHGEENLYLLNKGGVHVSKAWGGNGNLNVDGNLCVQNTCMSGADLQNMLNKSKT
jgi:hypothetical protein